MQAASPHVLDVNAQNQSQLRTLLARLEPLTERTNTSIWS